jgi:hypothetical protein
MAGALDSDTASALPSRRGAAMVALRATARPFWQQLASWMAAYAIVLHSFAAAVLPQNLRAADGGAAPTFTICLHDPAGSAPTPSDTPADTKDCQLHCMLAQSVGGLFAVAPNSVAVGTIEFEIVPIRWSVADDNIYKSASSIRQRARAPPLAA